MIKNNTYMTIPCDDHTDRCVETESNDEICVDVNNKFMTHIIRRLSDTKYLVRCLWCDKEFETYLCKIKYNRGKYCSRACLGESNGEARRIDGFGLFSSELNRGKNNPNWQGGNFQDCVVCGKPFWRYPSRNTETCSIECGWERAKLVRKNLLPTLGHRNQYKGIKNWKYLRTETLIRDNFTCQICGTNYKNNQQFLHAHHKIYLINGGENNISNLITLCKKCHFELHSIAGDLRKR